MRLCECMCEEEGDNEKEEACTSAFFNVPNFISSLFCTAITKRETESEREGEEGCQTY